MIRTSSALALSALLLSFCTGTAGASDLYGSTYGVRLKDSHAAEPIMDQRRSFCPSLDALTLEDLHAHEVKFGLRYDWY